MNTELGNVPTTEQSSAVQRGGDPGKDAPVPAGYKETEVGVIPEDWEVRGVSSFATTVASGRSHVTMNRGEYPVYGSTGGPAGGALQSGRRRGIVRTMVR